MKLIILVGTTTQTAMGVAQAIALSCEDLIQPIEVQDMNGLTQDIWDEPAVFLICTATHGSGDVPENAQAFYASFDAHPRYLGHVKYGVMALGDEASYPDTFANGGRLFDEKLSDLGARRLGELWLHDASSDVVAEEAGVQWCRAWLQTHLIS